MLSHIHVLAVVLGDFCVEQRRHHDCRLYLGHSFECRLATDLSVDATAHIRLHIAGNRSILVTMITSILLFPATCSTSMSFQDLTSICTLLKCLPIAVKDLIFIPVGKGLQ